MTFTDVQERILRRMLQIRGNPPYTGVYNAEEVIATRSLAEAGLGTFRAPCTVPGRHGPDGKPLKRPYNLPGNYRLTIEEADRLREELGC